MPTYEYACTSCGEHTDVVQSFMDPPLTTCSICGGELRKVYSPVGIAFKGTGFYRNDSRASAGGSKAGVKVAEGGEGAAGRESGSGDSGSGDSGSGDSGSGDSAGKEPKSGPSGPSGSDNRADSKAAASNGKGSSAAPSKATTKGTDSN